MSFSNTWTAPNGVKIVTSSIRFPDGVRSIVGVYQKNRTIGTQAKNWQSIWTGSKDIGDHSAQKLDQALARGDVIFYLGGNLGPSKNGGNWLAGWWSYPGSGVSAAHMAAFQWGMNRLANTASAAAQASNIQVSSSQQQPMAMQPMPQAAPMPQQPSAVVVATAPSRVPEIIGAVVVLGILTWVVVS